MAVSEHRAHERSDLSTDQRRIPGIAQVLHLIDVVLRHEADDVIHSSWCAVSIHQETTEQTKILEASDRLDEHAGCDEENQYARYLEEAFDGNLH